MGWISRRLASVGGSSFLLTAGFILTLLSSNSDAGSSHASENRRRERSADDSNCSATVRVTPQGGDITSPNYPQPMPTNIVCDWLLYSDRKGSVVLTVEYLEMENDPECRYDHLSIHTGISVKDPLLAKLCQPLRNKTIESNADLLLLHLYSDQSYGSTGFKLHYELHPVERYCVESHGTNEGNVTSPNYPNFYPEKYDCWSVISITGGNQIHLTFEDLSLENTQGCTNDFVQLYDGKSTKDKSLGKFCHSQEKVKVTATGKNILLHFHSDGVMNGKGFHATYTGVDSEADSFMHGPCPWERGQNGGVITSPKYPQSYLQETTCTFKLIAPEGLKIRLDIKDLDMEVDLKCTSDRLEIKDGDDEESKYLDILCGVATDKQVLTSQNKILVIFNSDGFGENRGFKAEYVYTNQTALPKDIGDVGERSGAGPFRYAPKNASILLGKPHSLLCVPQDSKATVVWTKDGVKLTADKPPKGIQFLNENAVRIQAMTDELAGIYTCSVEGKKDSVTANVTVGDPTKDPTLCPIGKMKPPRNVSLAINENYKLLCKTIGQFLQTKWSRNGSEVVATERVSVEMGYHLNFKATQPEDAGVYTCTVNNVKEKCKRDFQVYVQVYKPVNVAEVCGYTIYSKQEVKLTARINTGTDAKKGAYPWQIMLWLPKGVQCGGTMINQVWVATAAHCFSTLDSDPFGLYVRYGKHNQSKVEPEEFTTRIHSFMMHPNFNTKTLDNDIALIRVTDPVVLTDYIRPACIGHSLPKYELMTEDMLMGIVSGWGRLEVGLVQPQILQEAWLPIAPMATCRKSTRVNITNNVFCAGYKEGIVDACVGDSGGSFIMNHKGRTHLVGIVSWGEGCAVANRYGFYSKVARYRDWIRQYAVV